MWEEHDIDNNGLLDPNEAKALLNEIVTIIDPNRAKNYKKEDFDIHFERFDEDKNNNLSKREMA